MRSVWGRLGHFETKKVVVFGILMDIRRVSLQALMDLGQAIERGIDKDLCIPSSHSKGPGGLESS